VQVAESAEGNRVAGGSHRGERNHSSSRDARELRSECDRRRRRVRPLLLVTAAGQSISRLASSFGTGSNGTFHARGPSPLVLLRLACLAPVALLCTSSSSSRTSSRHTIDKVAHLWTDAMSGLQK
jgi:hypothetical protein